MRLLLLCSCYLFFTFVLKCNSFVVKTSVGDDYRVRVRRQEGYVYNKPSRSFTLPSQPSSESTQAPTVDRTLEQHMYYAYPAPARGDAVNIGRKTTVVTTTDSTVSEVSSGYNYQSSPAGRAGYSYGTPGSVSAQVQTNTASQVSNSASQNTVINNQLSKNPNIQASSGYRYNSPSPTVTPLPQGPSDVSTNAPKYLPPISGSGNSISGGSVNIGSVSDSSNSGLVTGLNTVAQTSSTSVGILSESYLPPLVNNVGSTARTDTSTSINSQTNLGGSVSVPSMAYLPPKSTLSPVTLPTVGPTRTSQPEAPAKGYIPPSNTASNSGTIAIPAADYLPPQFL